jgi:hypothetical protein
MDEVINFLQCKKIPDHKSADQSRADRESPSLESQRDPIHYMFGPESTICPCEQGEIYIATLELICPV